VGTTDASAKSLRATECRSGKAVDAWSEKYPDVQVCWTTKHNLDVAAALRAAAHSAQLLVVGRLSHAGAARPVPAEVIRHGFCPVAVVPQQIG